jgi:hypothetical protein
MAFRKKAEQILLLEPDILIVPECEHPDKLKFPSTVKQPNDILWYGTNENKGLGIFSYSEYRFRLLDVHNPDIKTILPIEVTGGEIDFTMFAIWAGHGYISEIWKALRFYEQTITSTKTMLVGDFNSNTIWDKKHRHGTHSEMVDELKAKGIVSAYHHHFTQEHGKEEHPTLSMFRHRDKPYHIDYCFASSDLINRMTAVEVGTYDDWHQLSDHTPLTVKFR